MYCVCVRVETGEKMEDMPSHRGEQTSPDVKEINRASQTFLACDLALN